jgi:hypothetical protein
MSGYRNFRIHFIHNIFISGVQKSRIAELTDISSQNLCTGCSSKSNVPIFNSECKTWYALSLFSSKNILSIQDLISALPNQGTIYDLTDLYVAVIPLYPSLYH